jgi:biopolymer transport protein ExbB/TolQ
MLIKPTGTRTKSNLYMALANTPMNYNTQFYCPAILLSLLISIPDLQKQNRELKKALSEHQLSSHKLDFEKKLLKKERDEFEKLLSDAESKVMEAEKMKYAVEQILDQPFENVEHLKSSIREALSGIQTDVYFNLKFSE